MFRSPRPRLPAGSVLALGLALTLAAPATRATEPDIPPGAWLFIPADTEAGLNPHLGWVRDGADRFATLFLVCVPEAGQVRIAIEAGSDDTGLPVSRTLEHAAGSLTIDGIAGDQAGATWVSREIPYGAATGLLATASPWRVGDARLTAPGTDAVRAFRQSCGLPPP